MHHSVCDDSMSVIIELNLLLFQYIKMHLCKEGCEFGDAYGRKYLMTSKKLLVYFTT